MGEVFLAQDPHIDRPLAIKTVRLSGASRDAEEHKQRLLREARAAGRLIHPNVVTLFDADEIDGMLFLAFEFVDGPDLGRRLAEPPPLSLGQVLQLVGEVASALDYAHHEGIIHRDIKPSNILLGKAGQAKVADFGLAKLKDESVELTRTGSVVGSPQYMSPEQVRGEALDGRTDVFSLGVLAYELLTRLRPFGGQTISTLVFEILSKEPVAIGQLRPGLPDRLSSLVHRMLAKDLSERVATAREVIDEVDRVVREIPAEILAAPAVPMVDDSAPTALLGSSSAPARPSDGPSSVAPSAPGPVSRTVVAPGPTPPPLPQASVPPTVVAPISPYTPVDVPAAGSAPREFDAVPTPPPPLPPDPSSPSHPPPSSVGAMPSQPLPTDAIASRPVGTGTYATQGSRSWGRVLMVAVGLLLLVAVGGGAWWLGSRGGGPAPTSKGGDGTEGPGETVAESQGSPSPADELAPEASAATRPMPPPPETSEAAPRGTRSTDPVASPPPASAPPASAPPASAPPASAPRASAPPASAPPASTTAPPPSENPPRSPPPPVGSSEAPPPLSTPPPSPSPRPRDPAGQPPGGPPTDSPWLAEFDALVSQASQEVSGGRFFHFDIEPSTAIVRVWRRGDRRQRVMGQAEDYAPNGKNTRALEVPEAGDYLFTVMVDGYPNLLIRAKVDEQGSRTHLVRHRFSAGSSGRSDRIQVSRAISFDGTPEDARVLVDGVVRGPAARWPGAIRMSSPKNMKLRPGLHTITIEAPGFEPFEVEVEVSRNAPRKTEKIRYSLRR